MIDTPHASTHDIQFCKRSDHTQRHFINCHLITCLHSSFQSHAVDYLKDIWFTCSRYEKLGNNIFLAIFAVGHRENNKLAATHRQHLLLLSTIMKSRMFASGQRLH